MENTKKLAVSFTDFSTSFINILDMMFEECPDGIVFKDKDLHYRAANQAFCKCSNIENKNEIIGKKENIYIPTNIMKLIQDADNEVMNSCSPINYVINMKSDILLNITTFPTILTRKLCDEV